uniref:C-type lectin domain-containing protein n=1 Tax=Lygus hesperus TaxID=30085 RepID=A0A0K8SJ29_LYGHE
MSGTRPIITVVVLLAGLASVCLEVASRSTKQLTLNILDAENPKTKKFEVFTPTLKWEDALIKCKEHHSDLATIRNEAENDLVIRLIKEIIPGPSVVTYVWIGGTNLNSEKGFFWMTDGETVYENYTNWMSGQPDNYGGIEYCLSYQWLPGGTIGWDDLACDELQPYVCEYYD